MGTLVVMRYPTPLVANLADHTYVKCDTGGRAWGCWGGKTGGTELRRGAGSTIQADTIAEPNERAGITCYAVNGVCHQAANRILYHAGITVLGARGYGVSESLYGTYGRTPRWPLSRRCPAPFDQHPGITGDLPECLPVGVQAGGPARDYNERERERERRYVQRVAGEYQKLSLQRLQSREWGDELVQFMATLFEYKLEYNLGFSAKDRVFHRLMDIRRNIESAQIEIETGYAEAALSPADFFAASDRVTASMQSQVAEILDDDQYEKLFDAKRGDIITLVDPAITGQSPRPGDLEPEGGR